MNFRYAWAASFVVVVVVSIGLASAENLWVGQVGHDGVLIWETAVSCRTEPLFVDVVRDGPDSIIATSDCLFRFDSEGSILAEAEQGLRPCGNADVHLTADGDIVLPVGNHEIALFDGNFELIWSQDLGLDCSLKDFTVLADSLIVTAGIVAYEGAGHERGVFAAAYDISGEPVWRFENSIGEPFVAEVLVRIAEYPDEDGVVVAVSRMLDESSTDTRGYSTDLFKLSVLGDILWHQSAAAEMTAIASSPRDGSVVVVYHPASGSPVDCFNVAMFDREGNPVWTSQQCLSTEYSSVGTHVRIDQENRVFISVAKHWEDNWLDGPVAGVIALSPNGELIWQQWPSLGFPISSPVGLAVSPTGDSIANFLFSKAVGDDHQADTFLARKFGPQGNEIWSLEFSNVGETVCAGAAVDENATVLLAAPIAESAAADDDDDNDDDDDDDEPCGCGC